MKHFGVAVAGAGAKQEEPFLITRFELHPVGNLNPPRDRRIVYLHKDREHKLMEPGHIRHIQKGALERIRELLEETIFTADPRLHNHRVVLSKIHVGPLICTDSENRQLVIALANGNLDNAERLARSQKNGLACKQFRDQKVKAHRHRRHCDGCNELYEEITASRTYTLRYPPPLFYKLANSHIAAMLQEIH